MREPVVVMYLACSEKVRVQETLHSSLPDDPGSKQTASYLKKAFAILPKRVKGNSDIKCTNVQYVKGR